MSVGTAETVGGASWLARARLRTGAIGSWAAEADLLLDALTGLSRQQRSTDPSVPFRDEERLGQWLARRVAGEPIQYITGRAWFAGLALHVDPRVLIPRPETEILLAEALRRHRPGPALDVGTGSGAVALGLAAAGTAPVIAVDISAAALEVARANAARLRLDVTFRHGDLLAPVRDIGPCGVVVANLPYVDGSEWAGLPAEVREHEPKEALVPPGGEGLTLVERLLQDAAAVLAPGAWLLAEIGATQGVGAVTAARAAGAVDVEIVPDLAGRDRVLATRFS